MKLSRLMLVLFFIIIFFIILSLTFSKGITKNIVVNVIDGDTIMLENGEVVRLLGINAPEKEQYLYEKAKSELNYLLLNKSVILERDIQNKDKYGRLLRYVFIDGRNINVEMIRNGLALVYIIKPNEKYKNELIAAWNSCLAENVNLCERSTEQCGACIKISAINAFESNNDINTEFVELHNTCAFSCNISGWMLSDSGNNIYNIINITLPEDSKIRIHTGYGENTKQDLFWNRDVPVWNNDGDSAFLRDRYGNLAAYFTYKT